MIIFPSLNITFDESVADILSAKVSLITEAFNLTPQFEVIQQQFNLDAAFQAIHKGQVRGQSIIKLDGRFLLDNQIGFTLSTERLFPYVQIIFSDFKEDFHMPEELDISVVFTQMRTQYGSFEDSIITSYNPICPVRKAVSLRQTKRAFSLLGSLFDDISVDLKTRNPFDFFDLLDDLTKRLAEGLIPQETVEQLDTLLLDASGCSLSEWLTVE